MIRIPRMSKLIFETPEEDLEKWMDTPLKDLGSDPIVNLSDEAIEIIDKPTGKDDKSIKGGSSPQMKSVSELRASQNEVGAEQSLKNVCMGIDATGWDGIDWGDAELLIRVMKGQDSLNFKDPLLGALTKDGPIILDGHHRWSQAFMVSPDVKVNIVFARAPQKSADEVLKAVHLAIYNETGDAKVKAASGGNLFNASRSEVGKYFNMSERFLDFETGQPTKDRKRGVPPYVYAVMKVENETDIDEGFSLAVDRVMDAISKCSKSVVENAPPRTAMPQADGKANPIDAAAVMQALSAGDINHSKPFVAGSKSPQDVKESRQRDALIIERWNRLAGLL